MPRLQPLTHFLSLTDTEYDVLQQALRCFANGVAPRRWGAVADRLLRTMGKPEPVLRVLDVSTGHLTDRERHDLAVNAMPSQCFGHVDGAAGILHTSAYDPDVAADDLPYGISDTTVAIMREAIRRGCGYVCFHADAAPLPGFPMLEKEDA